MLKKRGKCENWIKVLLAVVISTLCELFCSKTMYIQYRYVYIRECLADWMDYGGYNGSSYEFIYMERNVVQPTKRHLWFPLLTKNPN